MSVYIVQDQTINEIVSWCAARIRDGYLSTHEKRLIQGGTREIVPKSERAALLGRALFDMNMAAVEARYGVGQAVKSHPLDYKYQHKMANLPNAYNACSILLYQCVAIGSEGDIPETELFGQLTDLYNSLAHKMVRSVQERRKATA